MNESRRNEIRQVERIIEKQIGPAAEALKQLLEDVLGKIEDIKNAELEARDNLPESLSYSARAQVMDEAIEKLEELGDRIEERKSEMESLIESIPELIQMSDAAKGSE